MWNFLQGEKTMTINLLNVQTKHLFPIKHYNLPNVYPGEPIKNAKNIIKFVAILVRERIVLPLFISHNTQEGPSPMAPLFKI